MKIQLLSDLHNEFLRGNRFPASNPPGRMWLCWRGTSIWASKGSSGPEKRGKKLNKPVIYVAGNHEFYRGDIDLIGDLRAAAEASGVIFLEKDERVVGNVRFLGCTLWTDYLAAGDQTLAMQTALEHLSDHRLIRSGVDLFTPQEALTLHLRSRLWLEERLNAPFTGKTVVVTHHGPHMLCQHPSHSITPLSAAFWSDLGDLAEKADVWCFGHSHGNAQGRWGGCRLLTNQRGYGMENRWDFRPDFVFEV